LLDDLEPSARWYAVRAELLAREGRYQEAAKALSESLDQPSTEPERRHRELRRQTYLQAGGPASGTH
jgi:RNA polymerase sigma-70 factor (ECF subfamily)